MLVKGLKIGEGEAEVEQAKEIQWLVGKWDVKFTSGALLKLSCSEIDQNV